MVSLAGLSAVPDAYNAAQGDQYALQQAQRQQAAEAFIGKIRQMMAMRQVQGRQQAPMGGGMPQQAAPMAPQRQQFADAFQGTPNARPALDTPQPAPQVRMPSTQGIAPGSMTWDQGINAIVRQNPGIDPGVLAEAVKQLEPMMTRESREKMEGLRLKQSAAALAQRGQVDPLVAKYGKPRVGTRWDEKGRAVKIDTVDSSGKPIRANPGKPTQQELRNQQLYKVAKPEAERLLGPKGTFDSLSGVWDQGAGAMPFNSGTAMQSPEYQAAKNSLKTIIASYLYSTSGATANPAEVENQIAVLMPVFGEKAQALADKKSRIQTMVDAIRDAGNVQGEDGLPPNDEGGLPPDVTEEDIQHTMKLHGLTREQVLEQLGGAPPAGEYDPNGA